MSAKLLYSMSDDKQNLKKQIGCMNGLLQFFDPNHFINNRIISCPSNRRDPSGEIKQKGRTFNNASKKSKERLRNVTDEIQVSPLESSRLSISSCGSTTISSSEYDWTMKLEQSPYAKNIGRERRSWDNQVNDPHASPQQPSSPAKTSHSFHKKQTSREPSATCASPIKTASREVMKNDLKHMDSPRLSQMYRPDSPRLAALSESFRSTSSNHAAPAVTPRKKDPARLSYDGRETGNSYISNLKLKDLPRLSVDSKQQKIKVSAHESKESTPHEPVSYRAPSNIVVKLMGLEALPDYIPPKSQLEQDGSSTFRSSDSLSRSSRTIDESKVDRVLHSPRSTCKEYRASRSNKAKSGQTACVYQEAHLEPDDSPLTVYGAIEKRLADLNFQKSGKDLRALKHILESIHKEKNRQEFRKENQSSHCACQTSNSYSVDISQKQNPKKATPPTSKGLRSVKDVKSTKEIKPTKLVKCSRKEPTQVVQEIPRTSLQRLRIVQPVNDTKDLVQKKTVKDLKETHHIMNKYSGERTPRSIRTSKASETKANVTSSVRISDTGSPPATTSGSGLEQSQRAMGFLSQNQKLPQNSSLSRDNNDRSSEFSDNLASQNKQGNTNLLLSQSNNSTITHIHRVTKYADESCMKYETLQQVSYNKDPEGIQDDVAFEELAITLREQPSPVSVLDASFYEDECPSPVKTKPTAFRDFETNATCTEVEWRESNPAYSPYSVRPGFSYANDYQKLENIKESAPAIWKLNSYQHGNISSTTPPYEDANLEKSYVSELFLASGFPDHLRYTMADHLVHQSKEAIDPNLFFELEQTKGRSFLSNKRSNNKADRITRANERRKRRLLFDAVNEILSQKLNRPRPLMKKHLGLNPSRSQLLQDVIQELDQLQAINLPHSFNEDDFLTAIIGKDLTHRSANWTEVSGEIPALVIDIEKLIFKDLIVELVHDSAATYRP